MIAVPADLAKKLASNAAIDVLTWVLLAAAAFFLAWGSGAPVRRHPQRVSVLAAATPEENPLTGSGFSPGAVYPTTAAPSFDGNLRLYGSWLQTDASLGSVSTRWYRPEPEFYIFVCGYPDRPGNQLVLQIETGAHGELTSLPVTPNQDPGEYWMPVRISLARFKRATRIRLTAIDGSTAPGGWIGFSEPFVTPGGYGLPIVRQIALVILSAAASLVFLLFPGLVFRQFFSARFHRTLNFIWIPFPGLLLLSLVGLFAWFGPAALNPRLISKVSLWALTAVFIYRISRAPLSTCLTLSERKVLAIIVLLCAVGISKASYSLGPEGELFGFTISRTLEVGGRSDSRLPYHVIQLLAWRGRPFGPLGKYLYQSYGVWNFSHRGALTSLAEAPIILAAPVRVPSIMPDQPWTIYDPEGFAAFRIGAVVMACIGLITVFGLAGLFLPDLWALLALLVTVTAPFVIHETYFTWPKLVAASFVLLSAYLALRNRAFAAGLILGLGYLCHPSALLSGPAIAALIALTSLSANRSRSEFARFAMRTGLLLGGVALSLLLWRLINGRHFEQGMFLSYFLRADGGPRTVAYWFRHRLDTIAKTLIPLHTFAAHRADRDATSVSGVTPLSVLFCLQYWTTLPFGAGIAYFFILLRLMWSALFNAWQWLLLVFLSPFLVFVGYWGVANTGLLREGMHAWFLGLMIFSVCILYKFESSHKLLFALFNWALLIRSLEIVTMLLVPTLLTQPSPVQQRFALSDICSLAIMPLGAILLCAWAFAAGEHLRKTQCVQIQG